MDVWDRISASMKEKGFTAAHLSRITGIAQASFTGWKNKEYLPSTEAILKISKALCVPVDHFYDNMQSSDSALHYVLNEEEAKLIDGLRMADERTQTMVYSMTSAALSLSTKEETAPAAAHALSRPKDEKISQPKARDQSYKRVEGKAAAGPPISSVPDAETCISVPAKYLSEHYFIVQAQGDSMIDAHIHNGDYCVFQKDGYLDEGRIMLVQVDGLTDAPDVAIKRVFQRGRSIELHSANPKYPPMLYDTDSVQLMGILVDVITPDFRCA